MGKEQVTVNCVHFLTTLKNGTWSWHRSPHLGMASRTCCVEPDGYLNKTSSTFLLHHIYGRCRSTAGLTLTTAQFNILTQSEF